MSQRLGGTGSDPQNSCWHRDAESVAVAHAYPPVFANTFSADNWATSLASTVFFLTLALTITPLNCQAQVIDAIASQGQTARFGIQRFQIDGSKLLSDAELQSLVAPFLGPQREYGDIQRALEAIEHAYRARGYSAVQVYAPEQELTQGIVRLQVSETVIGAIRIDGQPIYFNAANLRAGLPSLQQGHTPNARELSAQIGLNNENPAKQIEVILGLGANPGEVDATLKVSENDPVKFSLSLDNSGSAQTGQHRLGLALQHANLWNRDHVASLAYQTSPEKPEQVAIYSLSYRIPVYAWAGAFDLILADSTVNAGTTPTVAGDLNFSGSGRVVGLRYTQTLPRQGDSNQKLTFGWDIKANNNRCSLGAFGAAGCGAAAANATLRPFSLNYSRMMAATGQATEISLGLTHNLAGGSNGGDSDFQAARPSPIGGTGARANYRLLKGSVTHLRLLQGDWQLRLLGSAQWTDQALLGQEQIGLAGSNAVRGFAEREVARDTGLFFNAEAYSRNLGADLNLGGSLRALAFVDAGTGKNQLLSGEVQPRSSLSSWGLGLRYTAGKDISAKLDLAQVITPNGDQNRGDWRGHLNVNLAF